MIFVHSTVDLGKQIGDKTKDEIRGSNGSAKEPKDRGQGSRIGGSHDSTRYLTVSHRLYVHFEGQIGIPTSAALRQSSYPRV
jgi:hypothetical protein